MPFSCFGKKKYFFGSIFALLIRVDKKHEQTTPVSQGGGFEWVLGQFSPLQPIQFGFSELRRQYVGKGQQKKTQLLPNIIFAGTGCEKGPKQALWRQLDQCSCSFWVSISF